MIYIVLFAIVGELGSGKTLGLSYLAWFNWAVRGRRIFSNYDFFGFPYTKVLSVPSIEKMQGGFFAGDELWLWLDSHSSRDKKARLITNILLKSRKRDLVIAYSTQTIKQIVKRVRDITDFVAYPIMYPDRKTMRMETFRGNDPSFATRQKPARIFKTEPIFAIYDTEQEIDPLEENPKKKTAFKECYNPISSNQAFMKYLTEMRGIRNQKKIESICSAIEKTMNPNGYKSEKERKGKVKEQFSPI